MGSTSDAPVRLPAAVASLRIYEPVEAFPADRRSALLAAARNRGSTSSVSAAERAAALRAAAALPPRLTDDVDLSGPQTPAGAGAQAAVVGAAEVAWFLLDPPGADGQPRLSPAQLRWRSLLALEDFRRGIPEPMLQIFVPGVVHGSAARDLAALEHQTVHSRPHAMVSPWQIPLGWLCIFASGDRLREQREQPDPVELIETTDGTQPTRPLPKTSSALRYRASMSDSRRTLARALGAVRKTPVEWLAASDLEGIGRWLEEFHPRSVVELDYGTLRPPSVGGSDGVPDDSSIAEMAAAMEELKSGRADAATAIVDALTIRWDAVRALEHAS